MSSGGGSGGGGGGSGGLYFIRSSGGGLDGISVSSGGGFNRVFGIYLIVGKSSNTSS
jgi:hypothetical protein